MDSQKEDIMDNKDMIELSNEELELVNGGGKALFLEVQGLLASKLGVAKSSIGLHSNLVEDLGADSLDVVDVLKDVSGRYNVALDRPFKDFRSAADICKLVLPKDHRNM